MPWRRWIPRGGSSSTATATSAACGTPVRSTTPTPIYGEYNMRGHSGYLPDSRFWRELSKEFTPHAAIPTGNTRRRVYRPDEVPMMNTENSWKVERPAGPGVDLRLGEQQVLGPALDSGRGNGRVVLEAERQRPPRRRILHRVQLHAPSPASTAAGT